MELIDWAEAIDEIAVNKKKAIEGVRFIVAPSFGHVREIGCAPRHLRVISAF